MSRAEAPPTEVAPPSPAAPAGPGRADAVPAGAPSPATTAGDRESSGSAPGGSDGLPGGAPPAPSSEPEITEDTRRRVLESLSDDDFKVHASLRDRYNKFISGEKKRLETENVKVRQEAEAYVNWNTYFVDLERDPNRLFAALNDPTNGDRDTQAYAAIKQWRRSKGGMNGQVAGQARESVATEMVENLLTHVRQTEEWKHLSDDDIQEIVRSGDVLQVLNRLLVAGTEREQKRLRAEAKAEIEAGVNEVLAKRGLSANEQEPPRGAVVGNGSGLTLEQYMAMTPQERRKLRQENPSSVDALTNALQEAQVGTAA